MPQFCWLFQHREARDKKKDLGPLYTFEITLENKYISNSCKHMWRPHKILWKRNFHLLKWWMLMNNRNRHFTQVTRWDFWISVQQTLVSSVSIFCFLTSYCCNKVCTSRIRKLSWWCLLILFISNSIDLWPYPLCGIGALIERIFLYFQGRRWVGRRIHSLSLFRLYLSLVHTSILLCALQCVLCIYLTWMANDNFSNFSHNLINPVVSIAELHKNPSFY